MMKLWLNTLRVTRLEMLTQGPNAHEQNIVGAHFAYWQRLTSEGIAFLVGRTQDASEATVGIAIFTAPDEASAIALCHADPTVVNGVMQSQVQPYRIALLASAKHFEKLS
jgi:uncharacterized protein YciI